MLQKGLEDGGHSGEPSYAVLSQRSGEAERVKHRSDHHAAPCCEGGQEPDGNAGDVEERQHMHAHIVCRQAIRRHQTVHVGSSSAMGNGHQFRAARGARGVQ